MGRVYKDGRVYKEAREYEEARDVKMTQNTRTRRMSKRRGASGPWKGVTLHRWSGAVVKSDNERDILL